MITVRKRTGYLEPFDITKVKTAIERAASTLPLGENFSCPDEILNGVFDAVTPLTSIGDGIVTVDQIHDIVQKQLFESTLEDVGIDLVGLAMNYASWKTKNTRNIFNKRTNLKPYEYPELYEYVNAIRHSYWLHTEFNYTSDIQDFKINLSDKERNTVSRAMLAISQIEIAVKNFWGDLYKKMPKPEIGAVGATFAESEVRHADAYSNLINLMGLNSEFERLIEVPAIKKRIRFLENHIGSVIGSDNRRYFESIILFSMFVENVSLFSQFLIIMAFDKNQRGLKGISNAVEATSKEEKIHAEFGFDLVNIIKAENPEWWNQELINDIIDATNNSWLVEREIVDWIFSDGDLDFLTKEEVLEFIASRYNQSLSAIGISPLFTVNKELLSKTEWFDDELSVTKRTDFFNKRSINYTKRSQSITANDLF